ncbi:nuclear factor, interleukin 3 regulated, member 3 [Sardina pilchardus]|uniref:nuclear factor, interleukin 3 regulated, member 3 n=1 Tax=Sardina pilchardus TaxID=27697 RepID=UPI002E116F2A
MTMTLTGPPVMGEQVGVLRELGGNCSSPLSRGMLGSAGEVEGALSFTDEAVSILTSSSMLVRSLLGRSSGLKHKESLSPNSLRRKREFIPDESKDDSYWDKRRKNNEAAKRSREKRRVGDMVLENRVMALLEENARLRAELLALKYRFGLVKDHGDAPTAPLSVTPCAQVSAPATTPRYYHHYPTPAPAVQQHHHRQALPPQHAGAYGARGARDSHSAAEDSGFSTSGSSSVSSPVFFDHGPADMSKASPRVPGEGQGYEPQPAPDGETLAGGNGLGEAGRRGECGAEYMKSLPHKLRFKVPGANEGPETTQTQGDTWNCPAPPTHRDSGGEQPRGQYGYGASDGHTAWQQQHQHHHHHHPREQPQPGLFPSGYHPTAPQPHTDSTPQQQQQQQQDNSALRSQLSCLSVEVAQLKKLLSHQLLSKLS